MAGMDLPEYLKGKDKKEIEAEDAKTDEPSK
jgi:flotillin